MAEIPSNNKNKIDENEKNIHKDHRKRVKEEFLARGFDDSTPDHKILEMLLFFCIPRIDTNPIAHSMINKFGSLAGVLDAPVEELLEFKGISESNVALLKLIVPVFKAYRKSLRGKSFGFKNHDEIGDFLLNNYIGITEERLGILCLSGTFKYLGFEYISTGDITSVGVSTRSIIQYALKNNAVCVVMVHNHPKGIALPSLEDERVTQNVAEALSNIGVHLLDHIIISNDDYVSMALSHQYEHIFKSL